MSFTISIPSNVKNNIHKLPHVQSKGTGAVIHDPSGVSLHITPIGNDQAEVSIAVDEAIVKKKLEDDIALIATSV